MASCIREFPLFCPSRTSTNPGHPDISSVANRHFHQEEVHTAGEMGRCDYQDILSSLKLSSIHVNVDDHHCSFDYLGTSTDVKDAGGADFDRLDIRGDTGTRATVSDWDPNQKNDRVVYQALPTMMGNNLLK